jgi:predicted TIM-barrel fold metal-dependent hydrolase
MVPFHFSFQKCFITLFFSCLIITTTINAQEQSSLRLLDWKPRSQLMVKKTNVISPRFPVIDIHNHLGRLNNAEKLLSRMDSAGVISVASMDGHSKNNVYREDIRKAEEIGGDKIFIFFAPEWSRVDEPGFGITEAAKVEEAVKLGARGVKVYKDLGLTIKDKSGRVVPVNDPRLDPVWAACGKLGIPVLMHVSDPKAFFTPLDQFNERYDELGVHPEWSFYGKNYPSKEEILKQRNDVLRRHPKTIFIGAHVANLPEELATVSAWLDEYPNLYVEIGARISELGRQPYTCRRFMIKYQDRILFGTDTYPDANAYRIYYRFLETEDEYFDPAEGHHQQGRWMIYGLHLPDKVLEKIYNKNAAKLLHLKPANR